MAKSGFTLFEAMIAMVVVGTLVTILLSIAKPNDVKQEALQKAGLALYRHIDFATNQIIIKKLTWKFKKQTHKGISSLFITNGKLYFICITI